MAENTISADEEIFTDAQVAEIIGTDLEDPDDAAEFRASDLIQVCAGSWVRRGPDRWAFDKDPEWEA